MNPNWPKGKWTRPQACEPDPLCGPLESKATTLEEFLKECETLRITECRTYGPGAQHSRTWYQPIGVVIVLEDACMPWNFLKPATFHWWSTVGVTPKEAREAKKKFGCIVQEAPYRDDDSDEMLLYFDDMDKCLQWLWENHRDSLQNKRVYPYLVVNYNGEDIRFVRRIFQDRDDVHLDPYDRCSLVLGSNELVVPLDQATPAMLAAARGTHEA